MLRTFRNRPWLMLLSFGLCCTSTADASDADDPALIDRVPCRIAMSGRYRLAQDLQYAAGNGAAITVAADDVTIDLAGNSLTATAGPDSGAVGILAVDRKRLTISGGRVAGFYFGIDIRSPKRVDSRSTGHRIARVTLDGNWYFGVRLVGSDCEIVDCAALRTGGSTRPAHTIPHGFRLAGQRNALRSSCVRDMRFKLSADGKGEIVGVHFDAARGGVLENCSIVEVATDDDDPLPPHEPRPRRFGLWVNGGPNNDTFLTVRNNVFAGFAVPMAFAPGSDGLVHGNVFAGAGPAPIRGKPASQLGKNSIKKTAASIECPRP